MEQSDEEATALVVGMAAFEPAPDGWAPDPATEMGGAATNGSGSKNGSGPEGEAVDEEEGAPSA
jgi:hypothetical protein